MQQTKHSVEFGAEKLETVHLLHVSSEMEEDQQREKVVAGHAAYEMFVDRELVLEGTTGGKVAVPEMTEQVCNGDIC